MFRPRKQPITDETAAIQKLKAEMNDHLVAALKLRDKIATDYNCEVIVGYRHHIPGATGVAVQVPWIEIKRTETF